MYPTHAGGDRAGIDVHRERFSFSSAVLTLIFAVYALVLGSRDAEVGEATARQLTDRGLSATGMELDVTDPENVRSVADEIGRTYGRLDVLVNNAGVMVEASAARLTAAEFRSVCELNLLGAATMVHEMLPLLRSSAHPRNVSVSSTTVSLSLTAADTDSAATPPTASAARCPKRR